MTLLRFLRNNIFLLVVFLTGAAVLIIEVTATRILSPFFGNTIFTVSSVISVILLALSIGYALGGRFADKRGTALLFYQLIALSGVSIFFLQVLSILLVPWLSDMLSLRAGPLVISLLLFFLPGVLLGMLSPVVVALQKERSRDGVGQTAGNVFFWSTLGSIVGSLGAGFYLIPTFGVHEIIWGVGVMLFLIGVIGMITQQGVHKVTKKLIVLFIVIPFLHSLFVLVSEAETSSYYVYRGDGLYDSIEIYDGHYGDHPARFLRQGIDASSAILKDSDELAFDYTKYYQVHKLLDRKLDRVLVIGGGAYSVPNDMLKQNNTVVVDVAEIESELYSLSKRYFQVSSDARLHNHIEDGRRFLQHSEGNYDVIFTDAFHTTIPAHLMTQEFYALTKSHLAPNGAFVMNIIGSVEEASPSFTWSAIKTFQSVYSNSYFFAVDGPDKPYVQNIILVGINGDAQLLFASEDPFLKDLATHQLSLENRSFDNELVFTDNYAPVEYFISKSLLP